jgi:hypothetical protein
VGHALQYARCDTAGLGLTLVGTADRYLEHQRGVIGILQIRLSEGRELGRGLDAARVGVLVCCW